MAKLIGYARVSTNRQDLSQQKNRLREMGVAEDDIYAEKISSMKASRPQLELALRALRPGDTLVVTRLDRFSRSTKDLAAKLDLLEEKGVKLNVVDQLGLVDTATAMGKMLVNMLGVLAEFERDIISERTTEALVGRKRGRQGGRKPSLSKTGVQRAQALYDEGDLSVPEIARALGVSASTIYRNIVIDGREEVFPAKAQGKKEE